MPSTCTCRKGLTCLTCYHAMLRGNPGSVVYAAASTSPPPPSCRLSSDLVLTLAWPPSVNHLHTVAHGRKILSQAGRDYYATVARACLGQLGGIPQPLDGWIEAWIDLYPPDKRHRDADGILKATFDSLEKAGVYRNDYQIATYHVSRKAPTTPGYITVRLAIAS
jgi:Holliday junction resolvase RusA-like endonuclease